MNFTTSSETSKCACCQRVTRESYTYSCCNIHIRIPLCQKCRETATFNLSMQLKPLCVAISRAVTMSHIVGSDEKALNQLQREMRKMKEGAEE